MTDVHAGGPDRRYDVVVPDFKKKYCYYTRSAKSANETLPMQKDQRLLPQYNKDGVTILNQL